MRINKLLFFFIVLLGITACTTEYVDYGIRPEIPATGDFKANVSSTNAKYVGDTFEFVATLNGVDVTAATDFKINGNDIPSNTYIPTVAAEYTVTAVLTMPGIDTKTATFKFTALKKDTNPEPEPTGNRIEVNGTSKPVTNTIWAVYGEEDQEGITVNVYEVPAQGGGNVQCTKWILVSTDNANLQNANNLYYTEIYVPVQGENVLFPHQSPQIALLSGIVVFNGQANVFEMANNTFNFINVTLPNAGATANYTGVSTLDNNQTAKLFWNGNYTFTVTSEEPGAKGLTKLKSFSKNHPITTSMLKR